jgi:hypothetical protein
MTITPITLASLTDATLAGNGVFDVLMRATKAHLENEFKQNRIKGSEYATVYLGSLESVLSTSLQFVLQKDKVALESQILEQQVLLAQAAVTKITAEIAQITAQTALVAQQTLNAVTEGLVLTAQKCKLDAEFDVLILTKDKTNQETYLLQQKVLTEKAQVTALGVDADSVIGKQKALYGAQTSGFTRDAEQKVAKVLVDSWNVRRTTDEGTVADGTNMLNDVAVGRAVTKLLTGVGA